MKQCNGVNKAVEKLHVTIYIVIDKLIITIRIVVMSNPSGLIQMSLIKLRAKHRLYFYKIPAKMSLRMNPY